MSQIPIQNLYFLLCYAWDVLPEGGFRYVDRHEVQKPAELLAQVIINGVRHIQRRGVDQEYCEYTDELQRLRGRMLVAESARKMLLNRGRALCVFDELSPDTLPNQIVLASLKRITASRDMAKELRHEAGSLVRGLRDVNDVRLTKQVFRRVQLHGNNRYYRFLLHACELLFDASLLNEQDGGWRFRDFTRNERAMAAVFEKFIFNFFRKEQKRYQVKSDRIAWDAVSESDPDLMMLPKMLTDISLRSRDHTLIIDAKYYSKTLTTNYKDTVRSSHLYQIFAYLTNFEAKGGNDAVADGILLYPEVGEDVSLDYTMGQHNVGIKSVDLSNAWEDIEAQLMSMLPIYSVTDSSSAHHFAVR